MRRRCGDFSVNHLAPVLDGQVATDKTAVDKETWRSLEPESLPFLQSGLYGFRLLARIQTFIKSVAIQFQLAPKLTLRHTSSASMGVDFADFNRDGLVDFFTVEMLSRDHARRKRQMGTMSPTPAVIGIFDDRPKVVRMWRENGFFVFDVHQTGEEF